MLSVASISTATLSVILFFLGDFVSIYYLFKELLTGDLYSIIPLSIMLAIAVAALCFIFKFGKSLKITT